jgi:predicted ATPase
MTRALSALRATRQHGVSSVVLISGPAGIGKTALLAETCEQAARMKIRVAGSKCDPIEQVWPGAPVIATLRAGRDPLTSAGEYEKIAGTVAEPLVLADRIASRLEDVAAAQPLLIAIDDLQWADRVSRFLLRSLVSRLVGLPVVWLLASRDDQIGTDLSGHGVVRVEHLALAPLTTQDLAAIARDRLGRVPDERTRRYLDATGGNPLVATQIIDGLARSVVGGEPGAMEAEFATAIAHQLAQLSDAARELAEVVAVAGRPLPVRDAFALVPKLRDADGQETVAAAAASGLITTCGNALTFRHDLVRETVYATSRAPGRATCMHGSPSIT